MITKNNNISKLFFLSSRKSDKLEIIFIALFCVGSILLLVSMFSLWKLKQYTDELPTRESIQAILSDRGENSKIYDRNGTLLYTFKNPYQDREYAEFSEIPYTVIATALAAEDKDFFIHEGIDYIAMLNGIFTTVSSSGDVRVGGSTITQQLVKQTLLTSEQSLERKVKEAILALIIERDYQKEEILEYYLNSSNFGGRVVGIKTAARAYFNKSIQQLNLNEAAFLLALVRSPGDYSPLFSKDPTAAYHLANQRRQYILQQIADNNNLAKYVNEGELSILKDKNNYLPGAAEENAAQELIDKNISPLLSEEVIINPSNDTLFAPHWVFYIRDLVSHEPYNLSLNELYAGGYQIYTSLDLSVQNLAQAKIAEGVQRDGRTYGFANGALVTIDTETGEILAMVGSKGYNLPNDPNNRKFDPKVNVTTSYQALGSSLKPWVAYLAFESGKYKQYSLVHDTQQTFYGTYTPKNSDGRFMGTMSLHRAMLISRNLPFLKLSYDIGAWRLPDLMKKIGYRTDTEYGLAATIGGVDESLLDHTIAYTGLANGGRVMKLKPVLRIKDRTGNEIFTAKTEVKFQLNPSSVATVNNILGDRRYSQNYYGLKFIGREKMAGKTGTSDANKDNYYMGYNPRVITGVWVGNNDNTDLVDGAFGLTTALPIWNSFMRDFLRERPQYSVTGNY